MRVPRFLAALLRSLNEKTLNFDIDRFRGVLERFENCGRELSLTFDDGPSGHSTGSILTALRKYNVRATFFCTGANALKYPDLLRQMVAEGHEIGSHSVSHPHFHSSSMATVFREMHRSAAILRDIGKCEVTCFRAPYGAFSWEVRLFGKLVGTPHLIGWDVAPPHDAVDPVFMARLIAEQAAGGSIINLHDGLADQPVQLSSSVSKAAAECLDFVIPALQGRGFQFSTVREQIALSN